MKGPSDVEVCFHHSPCNDGHAAAAVLYHYGVSNKLNISFHGIEANAGNLDPELCKGKNVLFLDVCPPSNLLYMLAKDYAKNIYVLDHHESNLDVSQHVRYNNVAVFIDPSRAGVELAWDFCHPREPLPRGLHYISLRDLWKHENNDEARHFNLGFVRPEQWWEWIPYVNPEDDVTVEHCITRGKAIEEIQEEKLTTMLQGLRWAHKGDVIVGLLNGVFPWTSELGARICQLSKAPERTIAIIWSQVAGHPISLSFRSHAQVGPNVIPWAEKFNGGGHAHAAGGRMSMGGDVSATFIDGGQWRKTDDFFSDEGLAE